jgi:hypothetical protein
VVSIESMRVKNRSYFIEKKNYFTHLMDIYLRELEMISVDDNHAKKGNH